MERTLAGKAKEITLSLHSYVAASKSAWAKLENSKDAKLFVEQYKQIQATETREDSDQSDHDQFKFDGTPKKTATPPKRKQKSPSARKQSKLASTPSTDSDECLESDVDMFGQTSPESEDVIAPTPKKAKAFKMSKDKKQHAFRGHRSSTSSEEEEAKSKPPKKRKKITGSCSKTSTSSSDFRTEVSLMREKHPDLQGVEEDKALTKKGTWRKQVVPAVTGLTLSGVNSSKGVHMTVATLSPRCYKLAEGIMDKWESGVYKHQSSLTVTQYLFYHLNGLKEEQDVYNVLQKFHNGDIESKREFDIAINEIKEERKKGSSSCTCREMETRKAQLQQDVDTMKEKKASLEQEVREMERRQKKIKDTLDDMEIRKEQLQVELDKMYRKKTSIQRELKMMETEKNLQEDVANSSLGENGGELSNWEGKEIKPGQLVAVCFSAPRRFHVGKVLKSDIEKQEVQVQFYKPARKNLLVNFGAPELVTPKFVLDTSVDLSKDGVTLLPPSKSEEERLKEKAKRFWSAESK
ncbi:uncharacterized protein LOC144916316 [Branchiostoma floridae x Branchiostoma belcheri]